MTSTPPFVHLSFAKSVLMLALLCTATAQARDTNPPLVERPLWELGAGVGVLHLPHYRGADQSHSWLLPVPYVIYRGEVLKADREGARALLLSSDRLHIDLSVSASAPTRSQNNAARQGMPNLAPTLEFGPNLNWTLGRGRWGARESDWELSFRAPLRAAVTVEKTPRHIGWNSTPHLNLDVHARSGWNIGLQAGPVFADRSLNGYFYNVSPAQATASRPAFEARGGYGGWQSIGALSRRFDKQWVGMFVKYDNLNGARFGDSPLVRQRQHLSLGIATSWIFSTSGTLMRVEE